MSTRNEIAAEFKWQLEDIFPTDEAWENEFSEAKAGIAAFGACEGTLGEKAFLLSALRELSRIVQFIERLYVYAHMRRDEDGAKDLYVGMSDRAAGLAAEYAAVASFVDPEILEIPAEDLLAWKDEPEFAVFKFHLEKLHRQRAHCLSKGEEKIMAMASEPLGNLDTIFSMLNNVDINFGTIKDENGEEKKLTHGSYGLFLENPNREVRKSAYEGIYGAFHKQKNTITALYGTSIKSDVFFARARGHAGALEAALFGKDVPVAVYEQLIAAVHEKLPALQKYLQLRKKVLGLDDLRFYDLYTPMLAELEIPMSYAEAQDLVKEALLPLGEKYQTLLDRSYTEGWIDVYETDGKRSGAYSWGCYGTHPYVLLNHQENLDSAFTLAHELGHALHSYHSNEAQPQETAEYEIMVAEVASTVNENLLMRHLLEKETDKQKRAYLLNQYLEMFRTTCFRQTMFAEFEMKSHRMSENGEPLTVESLSNLYQSLNALYYDGVELDENIAIEWMRIPHFYRAFYVYQYATGICTAVALANKILEGEEGLEKYIRFLQSGGSKFPVEILQDAGVDLTQKESILSALEVFEKYVDELCELLG
ncbi:MAG: oligoendopeptidase F [Clostridiales bacterium]|nr:oligoendopeptidase F [Clostridiales bacterium]